VRTSVVIPCRNAVEFIGATLASVLAQDHADLELIVVDDGSTDGSGQEIARFGERVRAVTVPHGGACRARNVGLALATGDAVIFLDADDLLRPDTVGALTAELERAGASALIAAPWRRLKQVAKTWQPAPSGVPDRAPDGDPLRAWISGWFVPPCALLWPKQLLERVGGWDPELTVNQDGDLVMRALIAGARLVHVSTGESLYRLHGAERRSVSQGHGQADARSRARVLEKVVGALRTADRLEAYRITLGRAYHDLARIYFDRFPELARACEREATALGGARSVSGPLAHRLAYRLLGLAGKDRLARWLGRRGVGRPGRRAASRGP
jgi:glycosyltransferase involved in cell wall biosynthesis